MEAVAIVGMAGRFPMAKDIGQFWNNIVDKKECISFYSDEELVNMGISASLLLDPNYVKARGHLNGIDLFDADFFKISPSEAELMDPQHRLCLECAWEALEEAGYDSERYGGKIGVFVGESMNTYLLMNVFPKFKYNFISTNSLQAAIGNDKDSLATTISYKMNLTGISAVVQTSSSTSLTAICVASQSILTHQCDIALAGGISIGVPLKSGYLYEEGGIVSRDGHCRPFDKDSSGFVPGNGVGIVVLKRLSEAIEDRDHIYAVIKGFAVNNDGSRKVSYSAPSVMAQAEVIVEAQAMANISPSQIGLVEAHGTGTTMGDPIEVSALIEAFGKSGKGYCAIGSVKANIGHLDTAAGVAGLIKASLALKHKTLPPSINYRAANPLIPFEDSPFYVNTETKPWEASDIRYAGVTSLGMGGTNAHVVLQEWPERRKVSPGREWGVMTVSAKTKTALRRQLMNMLDFVVTNGKAKDYLDDAAYTMNTGRRVFPYREYIVYHTKDGLVKQIEDKLEQVKDYRPIRKNEQVVFMFSGQGSQYSKMAQGLYQSEPVFRKSVELCRKHINEIINIDILEHVFADTQTINETRLAQPALVTIEYAMAQLMMSWGIKPQVMIGHSIGEYVAACLAGVFTLEDALRIVCLRGRIISELGSGAMLAARLDEAKAQNCGDGCSIAAVNSPDMLVFAGTFDEIDRLARKLEADKVYNKRLKTSHAFHSHMMEPAMAEFRSEMNKIVLSAPSISFISGLSGKYAGEEVCETEYWVRHLRETIRFGDGMKTLLDDGYRLFVEMGPGNGLCTFVSHYEKQYDIYPPAATIRHPNEEIEDDEKLMNALGQIWMGGAELNWDLFYANEKRYRLPLPTYPFEHKRYWIDINDENVQRLEEPEYQFDKNIKPLQITTFAEACTSVSEVWKELLGIEDIEENESFFDVGGDSIMLIKLHARFQTLFPGVFVLTDLFAKVTVKEQAEAVLAHGAGDKPADGNATFDRLVKSIVDGELDLDEAVKQWIN